jgi:hypothetical protein
MGSTCFRASRIRIRILLSSSKNNKKNINSYYCIVTSLWLFTFEEWCKCIVPSKSKKPKICCCRLEVYWRK